MKKIVITLIVLLLSLGTIGCGRGKVEQTGIRGYITKVTLDSSNKVSSFLVEGKAESDTMYDKATVRINKDTRIYKGASGNKLSESDLKEGMNVEVVFEGPVAESYPVQGKAKIIRVLE